MELDKKFDDDIHHWNDKKKRWTYMLHYWLFFHKVPRLTVVCDIKLNIPNISKKIEYLHNFDGKLLTIMGKLWSSNHVWGRIFYKTDKFGFYEDMEERYKSYYLHVSGWMCTYSGEFTNVEIILRCLQEEYPNHSATTRYNLNTSFKYNVELHFDEMIASWTDCVSFCDNANGMRIYPASSGFLMPYESLHRFFPTIKSIKLEFQRV